MLEELYKARTVKDLEDILQKLSKEEIYNQLSNYYSFAELFTLVEFILKQENYV